MRGRAAQAQRSAAIRGLKIQTPDEIDRIVQAEMAAISDDKKRKVLEGFLVSPRLQLREWEWSEPFEKYPCWIVADLRERDIAIAFSKFGHGALGNPWGLVFQSKDNWFGPCFSWFPNLEGLIDDWWS